MMSSRPLVLHAIHCLTSGGASQAMLALAAHATSRVRILSLTPARPEAKALAESAGIQVVDGPSFPQALRALEDADIVLVHAWNAPELQEFLRSELPPARMIVWVHVAGRGIPQVVAASLLERSDMVVASSSRCLQHVAMAGKSCPLSPRTILPSCDLTRFSTIGRKVAGHCTVGYVGSLEENKLDPNVVALFARVTIPGAEFLFVGDGSLRPVLERAAAALGDGWKFRFAGHAKDIVPYLAEIDLFAFPMARNSYASADLAIMEAMSAGIPAVVLVPDGHNDMIRHGIDGIVTHRDDEFVAAIATLARNPARRAAMGAAARERAIRVFSPPRAVREFDDAYAEVLALPTRRRPAIGRRRDQSGRPVPAGVDALLFAFDSKWPAVEESFRAEGGRAIAADMAIASAGTAWLGRSTGGLLHYLRRHPLDPWLIFWRALGFAGQGLPVRALANFERARELGFPHSPRLELYRDILLGARTHTGHAVAGTPEIPAFVESVLDRVGAVETSA